MANKMGKSSASLPIIAAVVVVFIAAIGFAMSTLGGGDKPTSVIPSIEDLTNSDVIGDLEIPGEGSSSEENAASSDAGTSTPATSNPGTTTPGTSTPGTSTPASSSSSAASSSQPEVNLPATFDPKSVGSTGANQIAAAKAKNSDVRGWIRVPGTNIDHPVLYNKDVNYYMAKDINKNYSKDGVIWADPDTRFGSADEISRNTVIYGHNWTNVSNNPRINNANDVMFGQLTAYHHLNFAKVTPYIHYSTEAEEMTWKVFAAFYTDIDFNYIESNPNDATFSQIISGAKARSRHNFDVTVGNNDKIITLSTCTRAYGSSDRQRFVVMARLVRYDEEFTAVNVTANANPVLPKL